MKKVFLISILFLFGFTSPRLSEGGVSEALQQKYENKHSDMALFYKAFNYKLIWLDNSGDWNKRAKNLLKTVQNSDKEGLNPRDYDRLDTLMKKSVSKEKDSLLNADQETSALLLSYAKDLFLGRLRNLGIKSKRLVTSNSFDVVAYLIAQFKEDASGKFLPQMTIHQEGYQRLKKLLAQYRESKKDWPAFPDGKPLKLITGKNGVPQPMKDKRVLALRKILAAQGYLKDASLKSDVYDEALSRAVENFQRHHVMKADGAVGAETAKMLNLSPRDEIDRILLAMERWRWLPKAMKGRFILVNIPGFQLTAFEDGKEAFTMRIIVGRQYRKTPTFSSEIYSVRFNPAWHVPPSIFRKDKLPKILNDPSYVSRKGFVVYDADSGQRLNPENVDWENGGIRLVQPPGSQNALGKIRFTLKTTDSVYLHGTPEKSLFQKDRRTFSSGCIRVENPQKLAVYVFNDPKEWPLGKIEKESSGKATKNIPLDKSIPIHIVYQTVWVDSDGLPYFAEDIYDRDRVLLEQLRQIQYPGYVAKVGLEDLFKEDQEPEEEEIQFVDGAKSSEVALTPLAPPSMRESSHQNLSQRSIQPYGLY